MDVLIVGAGPAGLMAAEILASRGRKVTLVDSKPSFGRKFLMAGKSGLNITNDQELAKFISRFGNDQKKLEPMLTSFGPEKVKKWVQALGQEILIVSTGRVFPTTMKASPLLRLWLKRLLSLGVEFKMNYKLVDWHDSFVFDTPSGKKFLTPKTTILALGGASWPKLGSDGSWAKIFKTKKIKVNCFAPSNVGVRINWSKFMNQFHGIPVKNIQMCSDNLNTRGEALVTKEGLEGGGIYELSPALRKGAILKIDLFPDITLESLTKKLSRNRKKNSISNYLRKTLSLSGVRLALINEFIRPIPNSPQNLAYSLKNLCLNQQGAHSIDQAISTAGGVDFSELNEHLMILKSPQVFCVGEMLDWEAPTGGYLINACLATGYWVGKNA